MIRTTFRIVVETDEQEDNPLDSYALASVFKSASARQVDDPNHGLPVRESEEEAAADAELKRIVAMETSEDATAEERRQAIKEHLRRYPKTITGAPITPKALDIYKETFAMRRSFGIPNTERTNIDTSSKKLPKIMPETIEKLFPLSSEEQLLQAAKNKPKTQKQLVADAMDKYPRQLPALTLRASLLHRPIWDAKDEVARHNWKQIVLPQTKEEIDDLQRDLLRLEVPSSNFSPEVKEQLQFDRLNLQVDPYVISVANESTNRFGDVSALLERFYELLNKSAFGENKVARVDMPYIDYEELEGQILDKLAAQETERQAELEAEVEAADQAKLDPQTETAESTEPQSVEDSPAIEDTAAAEHTDETIDAAEDPVGADDQDGIAGVDKEAETEEEEEPPSHYQGASALRFAEQTLVDVHVHERDVAQERAAKLQARAEEAAKREKEGITFLPDEHQRVWGIIFLDGTLAYFDSVEETFCEKPSIQQEDEPESVAEDAAQEAVASSENTMPEQASNVTAASAGASEPKPVALAS